jgi:hypothetical protein
VESLNRYRMIDECVEASPWLGPRQPLPNLRWSGRAVNKVPVVMLRRAAQLWR